MTPGFEAYAKTTGPRLQRHLLRNRETEFEAALLHAVMLFSYNFEGIHGRATANADVLKHVGVMLVSLNDVLRGILAAQEHLCPMALAVSARVATEVRAKLEFIYTRKDPLVYASRYWRHQRVEKVLHDRRKEKPRYSSAEVQLLLEECSEWIAERRPDGTYKLSSNWTADPKFSKIADIARAAGMKVDFDLIYATTSKYVHSSPLMSHGYRMGDSVAALGQPKRCKQMASLGAMQAMLALRKSCQFFGVDVEADYRTWFQRLMSACEDINTNPP